GPHLFVADDLIWAFTPLNMTGVHSPSWNAISWGVELVGDYSKEQLGASLKENAIAALSGLHRLVGLDPNSLRLHKEDPKTTHNCPGQNIVKADVIQWIIDRMAADDPGDHTSDRPSPGN
ncbi:MAG TPA: N-acetylmuramoyl-L-alanine amidase, partial [Candidatus Solibacter sp.]|nr:N-acetylmuramoyl-L-alanine amidase [Candidatus Solibacter sp.]